MNPRILLAVAVAAAIGGVSLAQSKYDVTIARLRIAQTSYYCEGSAFVVVDPKDTDAKAQGFSSGHDVPVVFPQCDLASDVVDVDLPQVSGKHAAKVDYLDVSQSGTVCVGKARVRVTSLDADDQRLGFLSVEDVQVRKDPCSLADILEKAGAVSTPKAEAEWPTDVIAFPLEVPK